MVLTRLLAACLVLPAAVLADVIYVDAGATGANDGSSWADAFVELQSGLAIAAFGDEIRVAQGTYRPDYDVSTGVHTGQRQVSFVLVDGAQLLGGYPGGAAPDPDDRDPQAHVTVLSGALGAVHSYHVVQSLDDGPDTVLDGFTIRDGRATRGTGNNLGGGLFLDDSDTVVRQCRFTDNLSDYRGGALACSGGISDPQFVDCEFVDNITTGEIGGAVYSLDCDVTFSDCLFLNNATAIDGSQGGGAVIFVGGDPLIERCRFIGNTSCSAGAIINGGDLVITDSEFSGNRAVGGVDCQLPPTGGAIYNKDTLILTNCTFFANTAAAATGAALYAGEVGDSTTATNCVMWGADVAGAAHPVEIGDGTLTLVSSLVHNLPASHTGSGNFDADPLFVDPVGSDGQAGTEDDDLRLAPLSPCIDAGDNGAVVSGSDIGGLPRVVPDTVDIGAHEYQADCNTNGVFDPDDLASGTSADCNTNGVPDECESATDCNSNGVQDICDIPAGTSADCNANAVPDECEAPDDCDANGVQDVCDLAAGAADCNANNIIDACDIAAGTSTDCDTNAVPDECDPDCNANAIADACDIAGGASGDCNTNAIPDECEADCNASGAPDDCDVAGGSSADCNANLVPDECETDCNANGVPDACDIAGGTSADCNGTAIPDSCELASGAASDCNGNGIPDACDVDFGTSDDCNATGIPDECEGAQDCDVNGVQDFCEIAADPGLDTNLTGILDACEACADVSDCADPDGNGIADGVCTWWECGADNLCSSAARGTPADMGSAFGACGPDGFCNAHDRNHALRCFAGLNTCDAINLDAGGSFGSCEPDGFCNVHDAVHALTCFAGQSTCGCDGGPAPEIPADPLIGTVRLVVDARAGAVEPGAVIRVDVRVDSAVALQAYQLHVGVSGGSRGHLRLEDISVADRADHVFAGGAVFSATNVGTAQMLAGSESGTVHQPAGTYLATFTYRASADAAGRFAIDVLHGAADHTYFVADSTHGHGVEHTAAAVVTVRPEPATERRESRRNIRSD